MIIAVNCKNGQMRQRMADADSFCLYEVKNGEIIRTGTIATPEKHGSELFDVFKTNGVNVLIADGVGMSEIYQVRLNRIQLFGGVTGSADEAVQKLIDGKLADHALASAGSIGCGSGGFCTECN